MIKQKDGTITHVGLVRSFYKIESHHGEIEESFLEVFNPTTEKLEQICIGFYCQGKHEENLEYTIDLLPQHEASIIAEIDRKAAEREARRVGKGKKVIVNNGKNKGFTGVIFWEGKDKFTGLTRFGVKSQDGTIFVNSSQVELFSYKLEKALA